MERHYKQNNFNRKNLERIDLMLTTLAAIVTIFPVTRKAFKLHASNCFCNSGAVPSNGKCSSENLIFPQSLAP